MKFQNQILNFERTDARTHGRTDKPKAICPFNFFKVWGMIRVCSVVTILKGNRITAYFSSLPLMCVYIFGVLAPRF